MLPHTSRAPHARVKRASQMHEDEDDQPFCASERDSKGESRGAGHVVQDMEGTRSKRDHLSLKVWGGR